MFGEVIQLAVGILTLLGLIIVIWTLRAEHDWRRRQYTLDIILSWSANIMEHVIAIEERFPEIRSELTAELTASDAMAIYRVKGTDDPNIRLRAHIIELLNYLEYIAVAYIHGVADKEIVEKSLKRSMVIWYEKIDKFVNVVQQVDGSNPWKPLTQLIKEWQNEEPVQLRKYTA